MASYRDAQSPDYRPAAAMPAGPEEAATLPPNQARQAVKVGGMRYVLAASTIGALVALFVAYLLFAG